jgi:integrase
MKRSDSMLTRVEEYLGYRRALGYALRNEGGMLLNFARFADREGHRGPLTSDLATRWARLPAKADRIYWARRIEVLVGLRVIAKSLIPKPRFLPGTFLDRLIGEDALHLFLPAARETSLCGKSTLLGWRVAYLCTLFGLLACTGLRISEALGFRRDEVDLTQSAMSQGINERDLFCQVSPGLEERVRRPLERFGPPRTPVAKSDRSLAE